MIPYPFEGHYPDDDWLFPDDDGIAFVHPSQYVIGFNDDEEVIELIANFMRAVNA